jgi:hypothetical protein
MNTPKSPAMVEVDRNWPSNEQLRRHLNGNPKPVGTEDLLAAERAEVVRLREALYCAVELARDAHAHWDADHDIKVGKILLSLAGHNPKYDPRADAIHAALATTTQGEQG